MSKIFINLLFLEGGTNLMFKAGSNSLALSVGECLPKLAIFNSCSCAAASNSAAKSAFHFSAYNSNSCNPTASLKSASLILRAALQALRASAFAASQSL